MYTSFWIYQIAKSSSIKHSKTRNYVKKLKISMRPWIRRYLFWRKLVITLRSWQLQSSYSACADLWTCWIRFWYSRSPKLTKMICFWPFSILYFFFIFFIYFNCWGRRHEALAFKLRFEGEMSNCSNWLVPQWLQNLASAAILRRHLTHIVASARARWIEFCRDSWLVQL